jgi:hypothetical protein
MLTCTEEYFSGKFSFRIFGTDSLKTQVRNYLDEVLDESFHKKLLTTLKAIDTDPLVFSHDEKFKRVEDGVWEIKIHTLRIACVWDPKPKYLIAIYSFTKKTQKWPSRHLENMRNERDQYLGIRRRHVEGDEYGRRIKEI